MIGFAAKAKPFGHRIYCKFRAEEVALLISAQHGSEEQMFGTDEQGQHGGQND